MSQIVETSAFQDPRDTVGGGRCHPRGNTTSFRVVMSERWKPMMRRETSVSRGQFGRTPFFSKHPLVEQNKVGGRPQCPPVFHPQRPINGGEGPKYFFRVKGPSALTLEPWIRHWVCSKKGSEPIPARGKSFQQHGP